MESPTTSKMKAETTPKHQIRSSPRNRTSNVKHLQNELYGLHRESSPVGFGCSQDLEITWGDSPEPLNTEKKLTFDTTPVHRKKALEPKESPRSTNPLKYRRPRSFHIPQKTSIDVAKYVAEFKEKSKNIIEEINSQEMKPAKTDDLSELLPDDDSINEDLIACTQSVEQKFAAKKETPKESSFNKILQSFMTEEDDWLSSVVINPEPKQTPRKGTFVKSRSDNHLESPRIENKSTSFSQTNKEIVYNNNNNTSFRRTNSFDSPKPNLRSSSTLEHVNIPDSQHPPLKKQKSFIQSEIRCTQYSQKEIERKRLEAECRKKKKEIERKRLEALKKLEAKKRNNGIISSRPTNCVASK